MKRLPIGKQVFRDIIETNGIYVDKTKYLMEMLDMEVPLFLSRPRRFGKTLTTHTLKEMYLGNKELFKNTYAYDNWDWSQKYPVIRLDMSMILTKSIEVLDKSMYRMVKDVAEGYSIELEEDSLPSLALKELIIKLSKQNRVALLVDEYDAPILKTLHKPLLKEIKETLRDFYTTIKGSEEYLKCIFITGISKFSKVGVFSAMNILVDITLNSKYSAIVGYTRDEIGHYFRDYIERAKEELGLTEEQFWQELKHYYNGYSWDGKTFIYNPFSVLNFFGKNEFYPYWMETGSPSYIIEYAENNHLNLENLKYVLVSKDFMSHKDIDQANPHSFLTQAGYLTIKSVTQLGDYILNFPNFEVEHTFNNLLIESQYNVNSSDLLGVKNSLYRAFIENNTEVILQQFQVIYSSIPYVHYSNNKNEHFYHTILLMFLRACGYDVLTEDLSNKGRSDLSLFWQKRVYLIELKINGSAQEALDQIVENNYAGKYANKECIHIGVNISTDERNVVDWVIE